MKYTVTKWTIQDLLDAYNKGSLVLSPPYQRNFIWSMLDQQNLIESIIKNNPIPNFFILKKKDGLEMVDGQQRSRTILTFLTGQFTDFKGKKFSKTSHPSFLKYEFPVTIIDDIGKESIEKFYALVNKTGIHLNKPEVRKAEFYNTNLLKMVETITASQGFKELKIFSTGSLKRMNDVEFISELVVLIKLGNVDKKNHVDDYFKKDLTIKECADTLQTFNTVLNKIIEINKTFELSKTRFKQKNDFYTLFNFILNNNTITSPSLKYLYQILVLISSDIRPTQEKCEPLKEYARNCVTQSNSKTARENRLIFFNELLLNLKKTPNKTQKQILAFYAIKDTPLHKVEDYYTLDNNALVKIKKLDFI